VGTAGAGDPDATGPASRAQGDMFGIETNVRRPASHVPPVLTVNAEGTSAFVLACDHASNRIPEPYGHLGLTLVQRLMHIAWDPGALAVALRLADLLDAPLVHSTVSRLVIDCNRDVDAVDLVPTVSERTEIPANREVSPDERAHRIAAFHAPFHNAIDAILSARRDASRETILATIHSFTPIYKDVHRPWPIGLIHGRDAGFTAALRDALQAEAPELNVGWNQPYSALNGVTFTLEHHGDGGGLPATMIEIRHDEILEPNGIALWASRLARCLEAARGSSRAARAPRLTTALGQNAGGING
jgi:predicted N-formylglutamate amidohydrolase